MLQLLMFAGALCGLWMLTRANGGVKALRGFALLLVLMLQLLYIRGRRYFAILCTAVYLGAVLIFFTFVALTLSRGQRWFNTVESTKKKTFMFFFCFARFSRFLLIQEIAFMLPHQRRWALTPESLSFL
jgi:NADH:ubiquinone oxidoreductase subunit 6 (subunit J)